MEEFHNFNLKVGTKDSPDVVGFQLTFESQGEESSKAANALSGRVNLNTRDVQVHLGIRNLDLTPYAALFPAAFPIDATTRMSQGDLDLVYNHERQLAKSVDSSVGFLRGAFPWPRNRLPVLTWMQNCPRWWTCRIRKSG